MSRYDGSSESENLKKLKKRPFENIFGGMKVKNFVDSIKEWLRKSNVRYCMCRGKP